jgi:hypothetical protein
MCMAGVHHCYHAGPPEVTSGQAQQLGVLCHGAAELSRTTRLLLILPDVTNDLVGKPHLTSSLAAAI